MKVQEPFYLGSGTLLDRAFDNVGFTKKDMAITNLVKCHPPRNRPSFDYELENCLPFLVCEIDLFQPNVLIALGRDSSMSILNQYLQPNVGVEIAVAGVRVMFYHLRHPSYAVRSGKEQEFVDGLTTILEKHK